MIVLDASALVEILLATHVGLRIGERIRPPEISLHAPHLIDLEVAQTVRRYVLGGEIDAKRAGLALECLKQLDLTRYSHELFLSRIWDLRNNLTAYDAAYVSLAEALGAPLLTCDRRLADSPGHQATIELFPRPTLSASAD